MHPGGQIWGGAALGRSFSADYFCCRPGLNPDPLCIWDVATTAGLGWHQLFRLPGQCFQGRRSSQIGADSLHFSTRGVEYERGIRGRDTLYTSLGEVLRGDVLPRSRLHHTALSWEDQGKRGLDSAPACLGRRCCRLDHSGCERCRCVVLRSLPGVALLRCLQLSVL